MNDFGGISGDFRGGFGVVLGWFWGGFGVEIYKVYGVLDGGKDMQKQPLLQQKLSKKSQKYSTLKYRTIFRSAGRYWYEDCTPIQQLR